SVAHAFSHILYKGLLFMGAGSVIFMTGKSRLTELGGLYRYMPLTLALYIIGVLSISAFPLFSGFVSKSMIISAAGERHLAIVWLLLTLASAGTILHTGLRLPYFTFFSKDAGLAAREPPANMLLAMGLVALLGIFVGVYPAALFSLLPYQVDYVPYTGEHIVGAVQLVAFTGLGFFLLRDRLAPERTLSLDIDWLYRRAGRAFMWFIREPLSVYSSKLYSVLISVSDALAWISRNPKKAFFMHIDMAEYRLFGRIHGLSPEASLEHIRSMRVNYPGRPVHRDPVGDAIIVAIILLMIYALYYIARLRLWT
ncbi:MAG TPA: hypothetical protein HA257_01520, partial [Candidatus Methanoperedenaceae archaeon]|nr:hypothetical protein [Candidatus Methanoperedenaceae archaeon]